MKKDMEITMEQIVEDLERESRAPLPWQHYLWKRLDRTERMLKWFITYFKYHDPAEYLRAKNNAKISGIEFPDISDVL